MSLVIRVTICNFHFVKIEFLWQEPSDFVALLKLYNTFISYYFIRGKGLRKNIQIHKSVIDPKIATFSAINVKFGI